MKTFAICLMCMVVCTSCAVELRNSAYPTVVGLRENDHIVWDKVVSDDGSSMYLPMSVDKSAWYTICIEIPSPTIAGAYKQINYNVPAATFNRLKVGRIFWGFYALEPKRQVIAAYKAALDSYNRM